MKKSIYISVTLLFLTQFGLPFALYSQSKADIAFSKMKAILRLKVACNEVTYNAFLNKSEAILDIEGTQIPIKDVKVSYFNKNESPDCPHWIKFSCKDGNCIEGTDSNHSAYGISIKGKNKCYEFINAFSDLKKSLN